MAPGDCAGLQANRPRRLHSGTRSFSIAFFAEPEFLLLHLYTALLLPALFLAFARKNPLRIFALRGNRFVGAPSARNRRKERLDLPLPVQLGAPANPAQGDMRMVLVAPFAIKRCRLKKPVLGGERNRIPNPPPFCARRLKKPVLGGERNRISNPPPFCAPAYEAGFRKQKKTQKSGLNNYHVTCRVKSSEG